MTETGMEILCIIPARGGSERVPGKNLMPINDRPMIAWTIDAAIEARHVNRTVVSTDDPEIAAVARDAGAEVIDRPAEISGARASSESALIHVLDALRESDGYEPGLVVFLQATAPLRRPGDVDGAVEKLLGEDADSLLSVSATPGFLWEVNDGVPAPLSFDPKNRPRSQELKDRFVIENGSIYVFRPSVLLEQNCRLGGKIAAYYQPPICAVDIDEAEDICAVDALMRSAILQEDL